MSFYCNDMPNDKPKKIFDRESLIGIIAIICFALILCVLFTIAQPYENLNYNSPIQKDLITNNTWVSNSIDCEYGSTAFIFNPDDSYTVLFEAPYHTVPIEYGTWVKGNETSSKIEYYLTPQKDLGINGMDWNGWPDNGVWVNTGDFISIPYNTSDKIATYYKDKNILVASSEDGKATYLPK